jgi:hypothetical protein
MKAIAKVQVLLDVHLNRSWAETETMQYIKEVATREATAMVARAVQSLPSVHVALHVARIQQITISFIEEP